MKPAQLEPGFLQTFRIFVATRIVFWIVVGPIVMVVELASGAAPTAGDLPRMTLVQRLTLPNTAPMVAVEAMLFLYLTLPQIARRLGRAFVPLALLIGLVPLLIGYSWWPSENPLQTPFVIFFLVMLLLIAWQYRFRHVIAYVVGLSVYQAWITPPVRLIPMSVNVEWLVLQAATMLLVGYIIVQLISIQREQRSALAQAYQRQAEVNERLKQYAAAVEELTISRERNRLARELHDTLAHSLSALTVQLEAVRSLWSVNPEAAREVVDRADETARRGLTEARRALQDLRATPLQDLGLVLALRELAGTAAERSGAKLKLHLPEQIPPSLPQPVEQGVYRIAQETLENIVRHAEAASISVRLDQNHDTLTLTIEDDGRGIGLAEASIPDAEPNGHLGIRGMQERASLIGGQLQIKSVPGEGTCIQLTVPV